MIGILHDRLSRMGLLMRMVGTRQNWRRVPRVVVARRDRTGGLLLVEGRLRAWQGALAGHRIGCRGLAARRERPASHEWIRRHRRVLGPVSSSNRWRGRGRGQGRGRSRGRQS